MQWLHPPRFGLNFCHVLQVSSRQENSCEGSGDGAFRFISDSNIGRQSNARIAIIKQPSYQPQLDRDGISSFNSISILLFSEIETSLKMRDDIFEFRGRKSYREREGERDGKREKRDYRIRLLDDNP